METEFVRDRSRSCEKPSKFNIRGKSFFLTYPKLDMSKEAALEALKLKLVGRPIQGAVVCRELHQDGTPHIHAYVLLEKEFNCKSATFWDINGHHGNYQTARNINSVAQYIKKDGDYIELGTIDWKEKLDAKKEHRKYLGKQLIEGVKLVDLVKEHPELIFDYKKIHENLELFKAHNAPVLPKCIGFIPNTWGIICPVLETKHRHYWFWSDQPNKGKTTFLESIRAKYPSMWYSWNEKFQTYVKDPQFVLIDEYSTGHLTVTQLNMMCDGTYQYPVKGTAGFQLTKPIVLVCGNRNPLDIYDEKHHELIKARFIINCLD